MTGSPIPPYNGTVDAHGWHSGKSRDSHGPSDPGALSLADGIVLLFVIALWASSFIAAKIALRDLTPMAAAFGRHVLAAAAFAPAVAGYWRKGVRLDLAGLRVIAPLAFIGITTYFWVQYVALQYTAAVNVVLIIATSPLFAAAFGWWALGEPVSRRTLAGLAIALFGAAYVATGGRLAPDLARGWRDLAGMGLGLANAIAWGAFTALGRKATGRYPPLFTAAWVVIVGTVMMAPIVLVTGDLWRVPAALRSPSAAAALAYLGLGCTVLGLTLWYRVLSRTRAAAVASFQYIEPAITAALAWPILGEKPGLHTVVGGIVIIGGVYLANRASRTGRARMGRASTSCRSLT